MANPEPQKDNGNSAENSIESFVAYPGSVDSPPDDSRANTGLLIGNCPACDFPRDRVTIET